MKKIIVGNNLLEKLNNLFDFSKFSKITVLTDENIPKSLIKKIEKSLNRKLIKIIIPAGEKEKNIETVKVIWKKMLEEELDRKSLLINLGGGVITDMGGFAASTFMRGIDFLNIPTTLLSQVDASVGGKTGVNFMDLKNGIGVFKNPVGVLVDVDTLKTLPKRELIAAFGEIIKNGVISGPEHFNLITSKKPEKFNQKELIKIIKQSIKIKSEIVKKDPNEKELRKVLNFGHTIGHAIESLSWRSNKPLVHGEAVAIGMITEARLSNFLGILSKNNLNKIEKSIIRACLPIKIKNIKSEDIIKMILIDKKNSSGKINWSLPEKIGKVLININVQKKLVIKAVESILI